MKLEEYFPFLKRCYSLILWISMVLTECLGIPDIHCISATLYATALLLLQSKDAYITVLWMFLKNELWILLTKQDTAQEVKI